MKRPAHPRKKGGPRVSSPIIEWIKVAPLSDEEWQEIVRALDVEPIAAENVRIPTIADAEWYDRVFGSQEIAPDLAPPRGGRTLRASFDFAIDFSVNLLVSDYSGPTTRELAAELFKAAEAIEYLTKRISPTAKQWLLERAGEQCLDSLEAIVGDVNTSITSQAAAIEAGKLVLNGDPFWEDGFLPGILELVAAAGSKLSLPARGSDRSRRLDKYPAFNVTRRVIDLVYNRAAQYANIPVDLGGLRGRAPATLLDRLLRARKHLARFTVDE